MTASSTVFDAPGCDNTLDRARLPPPVTIQTPRQADSCKRPIHSAAKKREGFLSTVISRNDIRCRPFFQEQTSGTAKTVAGSPAGVGELTADLVKDEGQATGE
jgi:hypothetical protein